MIAFALDAFESVEDQNMRRVSGKGQLQALQHAAGGLVFFSCEVAIGLPEKGIGVRIFVERPDEDAAASRERCLMQRFIDERGFARASRSYDGSVGVGAGAGLPAKLPGGRIGLGLVVGCAGRKPGGRAEALPHKTIR